MKTVLEILTDPNPSERDVFIIGTARAIVERNPRTSQSDPILVARALCAAVSNGVYEVPLSPNAFGLLYTRIIEACTFYRRYSRW